MMTSAAECLYDHARPFQDALHCVTQAKLIHKGWSLNTVHTIALQQGTGVPVRRSGPLAPFRLTAAQGYRIIREPDEDTGHRFRLTVEHYAYKILASDGREVVAFHWHPGRGGVDWPHIHVGSTFIDATQYDIGRRFSSLHLPTSRISIEQVVEALITQFDVTPLRADWQTVLNAGKSTFREFRTWA